MPRKRIHELAKEWGMDTRYLLSRLEELGVQGKRAQSTLTDDEIALVRPGPAVSDTSALVIGEEKVVGERVVTEVDQQSEHVVTAREEILESRISHGVIRRRAKRVEVLHEDEANAASVPTAPDSLMPAFEVPLPSSSTVPLAFEIPEVEPSPSIPVMPFPEPTKVEPQSEPITVQAQIVTSEISSPEVERPSPPPVPVAVLPEPVAVKEAPRAEVQGVTSPPPPPAVPPARPPVVAKVSTPSAPERPLPPPRPVVAPAGATTPPPRVSPGVGAATVASAAAKEEPARPTRILGRIDLGKLTQESRPKPEARPTRPPATAPGRPPAAPPTVSATREPSREGAPAAEGESASAAGRRPKKRKVIRSAEQTEIQERDPRTGGRGKQKKKMTLGKEQRQTEITVPKASKRVVRISEVVTVGDLARNMGVKAGEVIKKLISLGVMATINQTLDFDTASLVAADFDHTVENVAFDVESALEVGHEEHADEGRLEPRPPVVTIMGHVDHGKTSLLDAVRKTNVTAQEHGGITQHIGAYSVNVDGRSVTFLDTPGHEAFTAMRARGAEVTDIVTLVVAADDGVMPQTVEAINHAKAAKVPIIVAVNKIDKPGADLERVKRELMNHGIISEELGGEAIFAPVSAKTGEGIPHLLEMILLQADVMDLRAHPDKLARGTIVEAKLDRGRGPVATVLVQEGELKTGDPFVCGTEYGRVRAMIDSWGNKVEKASSSVPVEILGLTGVPEAGDRFTALEDEASARQVAEHRRAKKRETELSKSNTRSTLEEFYQQAQAGEVKELRVIVKADVQGSAEAVSDSLNRLSNSEVKLTILHTSVGGISESDVLLASASKGVIIGFNVRPESKAMQLAEREGVEVRLYNIIYEVIEDMRAALEGMLAPTFREKPLGKAEVRQVFPVSRLGLAAGCAVNEGRLTRGAQVRVIRNRQVVYEGKIGSLRRFKDDVREVTSGMECGVLLENFQEPLAGDLIEAFEMEQVLRRLEPRAQ
ncbi:MAG: translation initiation factor IF-2 [Deltaproteobacteria bacterium]|nr:translation initiation factor IF-2 [Deltaproteobacteria bacterium]